MTQHDSARNVSTAELVQQLADQTARLVRDEIKLAQIELTSKSSRLAKGAGMFGGSGVAVAYGVGCLLAAAIAGLATVMAIWLAALIVAAAVFASAAIAALAGRREIGMAKPLLPRQAVDSVKADAQTIGRRARR